MAKTLNPSGAAALVFSSLFATWDKQSHNSRNVLPLAASLDLHKQIVLKCTGNRTEWGCVGRFPHARQARRKHDRFIVGSASAVVWLDG